jgi:hypothetical protein
MGKNLMIYLKRKIKVSSFDMAATVARGQNRPEFLAVARLAADLNRPIGARDVLRELLGGLPETVGWRVIERSISLGLLERKDGKGPAVLTDIGRNALEHNTVLVPEEATWRFFYTDDPLVPDVLIHALRLPESSAYESKKYPLPDSDVIPKPLQACCSAAPRLSVCDQQLFQLAELAPTKCGAHGPVSELDIELMWESSLPAPRIHLSGSLGNKDAAISVKTDLQVPEVVKEWDWLGMHLELLRQASSVPEDELWEWLEKNSGDAIVPCVFSTLKPHARKAFMQDFKVSSPCLDGLGAAFQETTLKDIKLAPASAADAQEWLEWLQWEAIRDHAIPEQLNKTGEVLRKKFPFHTPVPATPHALLNQARTQVQRDEQAWFLMTPADLGLWS